MAPVPNEMIRYVAVSEPEATADSRTRRFKISSSAVARDGHTLATAGWKLDNFRKNPTVLVAHDAEHIESVIGRATIPPAVGDDLYADIEFMPADINPLADMTLRMVDGGWLRATSVGFIPLDGKPARGRGPGAYDFSSQELLEISIVPVGSLPDALLAARAAGIDTTPALAWARRIVESADMTASRKRAATADWTCAASRDLPTSTVETWDGPAAETAILDAATTDGKIDPAKAKLGFLIYDAANGAERGSYKEPFATMIDGKLTVTKGGVQAAASRLPQVDGAAQSVKDEARAVLDHYEEKLGMAKESKDTKRAPRLTMKRDLWDVSWLAYLLMELSCIHDCVVEETAAEGDGSGVPAQLGAALKALGETLIAMTAEEVEELLEGTETTPPALDEVAPGDRMAGAIKRAVFAMVRQAAGKRGAQIGADSIARMDSGAIAAAVRGNMLSAAGRRALADMIETRAGRVLSATNEEHLRSAQDHMTRAAEHVSGVLSSVDPDDDPDDETDDGIEAEARAARGRRARLSKLRAELDAA